MWQCHLVDWHFVPIAKTILHFFYWRCCLICMQKSLCKHAVFFGCEKDLRVTAITGDTYNWFMNLKICSFFSNFEWNVAHLYLFMSLLISFHLFKSMHEFFFNAKDGFLFVFFLHFFLWCWFYLQNMLKI